MSPSSQGDGEDYPHPYLEVSEIYDHPCSVNVSDYHSIHIFRPELEHRTTILGITSELRSKRFGGWSSGTLMSQLHGPKCMVPSNVVFTNRTKIITQLSAREQLISTSIPKAFRGGHLAFPRLLPEGPWLFLAPSQSGEEWRKGQAQAPTLLMMGTRGFTQTCSPPRAGQNPVYLSKASELCLDANQRGKCEKKLRPNGMQHI